MLTRFVFTCISSLLFADDATLDELHEAIAEDAYELFTNGLLVASMQ